MSGFDSQVVFLRSPGVEHGDTMITKSPVSLESSGQTPDEADMGEGPNIKLLRYLYDLLKRMMLLIIVYAEYCRILLAP